MSSAESTTPPRRRGRRQAGGDTRAALLAAARSMFAENGYDRATVRSIAARAGVDPAMVNHWFGGKEGLFTQAVLRVPVDFREVLATITTDGPHRLGENIVRTFISTWDGAGGDVFVALVRSVTTHTEALEVLKRTLTSELFAEITRRARNDRPELRASLCAAQVLGLGMTRYVLALEPLASARVETVVDTVAPTLQRYLTGELTASEEAS